MNPVLLMSAGFFWYTRSEMCDTISRHAKKHLNRNQRSGVLTIFNVLQNIFSV